MTDKDKRRCVVEYRAEVGDYFLVSKNGKGEGQYKVSREDYRKCNPDGYREAD
jgi:hypothetical protein